MPTAIRHFVTLLTAGLFAASANAQDKQVVDIITGMNEAHPTLTAADARAAILDTARAFGEKNGTCIPQTVTIEDPSPITGVKIVLQGILSGQLRNGWSVYATYDDCEGAPLKKHAVLEFETGEKRALIINDGRVISNMSIMRDTGPQAGLLAYTLMKKEDEDCEGSDMKMGEASVLSRSDDLGPDVFGVRYTGSWSENWRFEACGLAVDVPVTFRADGDGGAYTNVSSDGAVVSKIDAE